VQNPDPAIDIIWGAKEIGAAVNLTARQAFHLLESGHLPAKKIGGKWAARLDLLQKHFEATAA
jgi:hypothetical protein